MLTYHLGGSLSDLDPYQNPRVLGKRKDIKRISKGEKNDQRRPSCRNYSSYVEVGTGPDTKTLLDTYKT